VSDSESASLIFGKIYHVQNGYKKWQGGYLDTRGTGCEDNLLCVSTADSPKRDGDSGTWRIESASGKPDGAPVLFNDEFYLRNMYNDGNGGYLDTRGTGCEGNLLCVSTATGFDRANGSGTWKLIPDSSSQSAVAKKEPVHILNGYSGWTGGFLDTRGSGCEGNELCVSTTAGYNRDAGSTHWRFSAV
jgi:hypothetical protein